MADNYSNYLKVILFPGDICETNAGVSRSNCFTVQHFSYKSKRYRGNKSRVNYHAEEPTVLEFTIRINTPNTGKDMFSQIKDQDSFAYSFLFNSTFGATNMLTSYDDAMVACGHIIDIEEVFSTSKNGNPQEQMLMHVKLLLNTITFIGKQHNLVLSIN